MARKIREKLTGKLLTLDRALEPTLPALLALLDVSVDPSAGSGQASGATLIRRNAASAHWMQ